MNRSGHRLVMIGLGLMIVVGLLLGPGYYFYCVFFTGSAVGEYPIELGRPVEIELTPQMNPIRMGASIEYRRPTRAITRHRTDYQATLTLADDIVWRETFGVAVQRDRSRNRTGGKNIRVGRGGAGINYSSIQVFSVDRPGRYALLVEPGTHSGVDVREITLKVRRNIAAVHVPTAVTGVLLLVLGIVGCVVTGLRFAKRPEKQAHEPSESENSSQAQ